MSIEDSYRNIAARLRGWGFEVVEYPESYGANNGIHEWNNGVNPDGHIDHHFVCSLKPDKAYIQSCVDMLRNGYGETPGPVVNWFADVLRRAHLLATRPANHSGRGSTAVLQRVKNDQAPLGPAAQLGLANDFTGNAYYSGTESQHPGDSTPWPDDLLEVMVAIAAAEAIEFGWTANRIINHYDHTDRKVDMSFMGGPSGTSGSDEFRRRVAARMAGDEPVIIVSPEHGTTDNPPPTPPEDEVNQQDKQDIVDMIFARQLKPVNDGDVQASYEDHLVTQTRNTDQVVKAVGGPGGVLDLLRAKGTGVVDKVNEVVTWIRGQK